jgi:hypothetical protein
MVHVAGSRSNQSRVIFLRAAGVGLFDGENSYRKLLTKRNHNNKVISHEEKRL